jgi:guanylate cyclase
MLFSTNKIAILDHARWLHAIKDVLSCRRSLMIRDTWRKLVTFLSRIGAESDDTDEVRLQKTVLVAANLLGITLGTVFIVVGIVTHGEPINLLITAAWAVITAVNVYVFARTGNFDRFRFWVFLVVLIVPSVQALIPGPFIESSAGILWAYISPLLALIGTEPRKATRWFLGFLTAVAIGGILDPLRETKVFERDPTGTVFFVMNIAGVTAMSFFLLRYFVIQRDKANRLLALEKERSEGLLLNILPEEVAEILKVKTQTIAERYDEASVLFADLVGFTPLSAIMDPADTVEMLNEIYSHLDSLADKYDVEKIRTIGDNYMVVSGVPTPRGPLVAGVIGKKKFHYDVWGDTVNTASRMQSHAVPGKIQISQATRDLLGEAFVSEERGSIDIKGKGEMKTWFLVSTA